MDLQERANKIANFSKYDTERYNALSKIFNLSSLEQPITLTANEALSLKVALELMADKNELVSSLAKENLKELINLVK